ncbi:hypothetical protein BUALT_Bualt03G0044600 [Buddleja alternifolia]|uniref:Uncharacterized protein n=1 Tax=Buddleja alternifolia TaxID=168488 RepID=A0AAV6XQY6_9LAMI|nr:hypothetical protein BUALT_Bualt03G0044600 [Buddleja alternifolia]
MDNSSLCDTSVSGGENSCDSITSSGDQNSVDKLSTGLSDKLQINGGNGMNKTNDIRGRYIEDEEEEEEGDEDEDDFSEEALLAQMGYVKSEPKRVITKESQRQYHDEEEEYEDEEDEDLSEESFLAQMGYLKDEPPKHEPITTPTAALNLVSAFKGSRSKEGKPAKECRVSWAPDVYDPPPTSDDHFTLSKTERHKSEQKVKGLAGKNRQKCGGKGVGPSEIGVGGGKGNKGGASKASAGGGGGGGKEAGKGKDKKKFDKKQVKKHGGGASKYHNFGED